MIYRTDKTKKKFTQIDNEIFNSKLSDKGFKTLIYMLTFSNDWKFNRTKILKDLEYSEKTLDSAFRELKSKGYLTTIRKRKTDGTYEWTYEVYENPALREIIKDTTIPPKTILLSSGEYNNTNSTKRTEKIKKVPDDTYMEYEIIDDNSKCQLCSRTSDKLINRLCQKCNREFNDIPF